LVAVFGQPAVGLAPADAKLHRGGVGIAGTARIGAREGRHRELASPAARDPEVARPHAPGDVLPAGVAAELADQLDPGPPLDGALFAIGALRLAAQPLPLGLRR